MENESVDPGHWGHRDTQNLQTSRPRRGRHAVCNSKEGRVLKLVLAIAMVALGVYLIALPG